MGLFQQPVTEWCFPPQARRLPWVRAVALALRAGHLAAVAFLLGGHAYGADTEALYPWLLAAVATGAGLVGTDVLTWGLHWFGMAKGISVLAKLALLLVIPFAWGARVPILLVVLVGSAVTSHMPARFRNFSFLHGRRLDPDGPLGRGAASRAKGARVERGVPPPRTAPVAGGSLGVRKDHPSE